MTQVAFALNENNPTIHLKLNQAIQGHRFRHRSTFVGRTEQIIYNFNFRTTAIHVRMVGGGGGGGGAKQAPAQPLTETPTVATVAVGGGSGAYYEFFLTDATLLGNTFYIQAPPGGAGGLPNSPGTNGGSAQILYDRRVGQLVTRRTLAFAGGGQGGGVMVPGPTHAVNVTGGLGGLTENYFVTPHDIFMNGEKGGYAVRDKDNVSVFAYSGRGGESIFSGGGGLCNPPNGQGKHAEGIGGGGGGAAAYNAADSTENYFGGNGGSAGVFIDEYY